MALRMDSNLSTIAVNGYNLRLQLRDVIQVIVTIASCLTAYFILSNQTHKNSYDIDHATEDRQKLWVAVDNMNNKGTAHSHETDEKQQQSIDMLFKQYDGMNQDLRNLIPKVDKIDTNVLWLMSKYMEKK